MVTLFEKSSPDVVFHLASLVLGEHRSEDLDSLVESNLAFGLRVAEAMLQTGVRRLVNTGSYWQHFGDRKNDPVNLYAATKTAFEELLRYYVNAKNFCVINLELFDVYGPDDQRPKLIPHLVRALGTEDVLKLSPGEQILDLVYISDVISAYKRAAELLLSRQSDNGFMRNFAVSGAERQTLKDVVARLRRVSGLNLNIEWGARPYRNREVMKPWSNGEPLPGWVPSIDLTTGFLKMIGSRNG
jgi:nucleoside-diphosphate-sugar epimerase